MEYNVPQKTRVLVWEGEDRNHVASLNKSKRSIGTQVLHCWSCGLLTDFYMKHGQVSLVRFLEKYFNHVENWTGRFDGDTEEFVFGDTFFEDVMARTVHFNHHTDGAIMTLPRIVKYQERGYSFPKPELMKVGLTLANYNLQSWDDVSNVLSGTYGSSFSNLADNMKEKGIGFSFDEAINVISKCEEDNIDDEDNRYYISAFDCADTIRSHLGLSIKYFVHNNIPYDINFCKLTSVPEGSTRVELESLVKLPLTLYKSIERNGRSIYDSNFVYKEGEYAVANNDLAGVDKIANGAGLYFRKYANEVNESCKAFVVAKVFNYDDIMIETLGGRQSYVVCKRAFIERITTDSDEIMLLKQNEKMKNKNAISF